MSRRGRGQYRTAGKPPKPVKRQGDETFAHLLREQEKDRKRRKALAKRINAAEIEARVRARTQSNIKDRPE